MKTVFWHNLDQRERNLAMAVANGAASAGEQIKLREVSKEPYLVDCDTACMIGVKMADWFRLYRDAGKSVVFFDKGYVRAGDLTPFWRVSTNGQQPLWYVAQAKHDAARWDKIGIAPRSWRQSQAVLIAGSSAKAMRWSGIPDATAWVRGLVELIQTRTDAPIIYRPKPSWRDAEPIDGTEFSRGCFDLQRCMKRSRVMITHSSNACFDAVLFGLPSIVLGEGIAGPISSTSIDDIEKPRQATMEERNRWLANVAWCQFTLQEFADGLGWRQIRTMIEAAG